MKDRIELNKIQALGTIGVLPEEKNRAQPFEIDLAIETDLSVAGASDDLDDTINYGEVTELVAGIIQNCLLYTSPSPRDNTGSRMPSSA